MFWPDDLPLSALLDNLSSLQQPVRELIRCPAGHGGPDTIRQAPEAHPATREPARVMRVFSGIGHEDLCGVRKNGFGDGTPAEIRDDLHSRPPQPVENAF